MTSNADVRAAWRDHVFANINAGANAYDYTLWPETRKQRGLSLFQRNVDFWLYHVRHRPIPGMCGALEKEFSVEVSYILENSPSGTDRDVTDALQDTLHTLVRSSLGPTWQGTVRRWLGPIEEPRVTREHFAEQKVWHGRVIYRGYQLEHF